MGIDRGWEKRVIRTKITYAKQTVRIFSVSPQSRSLFSASFQTFRCTARSYLNTQNYGLFCGLSIQMRSSLEYVTTVNNMTIKIILQE